MICNGPRRAANVARVGHALFAAARAKHDATATTTAAAASRQRGCALRKFNEPLEIAILQFPPLPVVLDVKNSHVRPELQPRDGVADERLGALVLGGDQIVLRIHLVLRFGAAEFSEKVLFLDAPFGEFHAEFADFVIPLGLVQRAPAVAHLEPDFVRLLLHGPRRLLSPRSARADTHCAPRAIERVKSTLSPALQL